MNIVIRVDASVLIGSGHVMRCLTLAETLRDHGYTLIFICRDYPGNLIEFIQSKGFSVIVLAFLQKKEYLSSIASDDYQKWLWLSPLQDAKETIAALQGSLVELLIVDHYALDAAWERELKSHVHAIMVIDDLANRRHDCNLLLDQNFYLNASHRYDGYLPSSCKRLLGPEYALLKPALVKAREARQKLSKLDGLAVEKIIIFMGAVDSHNMTLKAMLALKDFGWTGQVNVVVGLSNLHQSMIEAECRRLAYSYHVQPENYVQLLIEADLAIAAGGSSLWERCCIGLPSISIALALNQEQICQDLASYGAHYFLGTYSMLKQVDFQQALSRIIQDKDLRRNMMDKAMKLVDGQGERRVYKAIASSLNRNVENIVLRKATLEDIERVFNWRNNELVRRYSFNKQVIDWEEHVSWFTNSLKDPARIMLIAELPHKPLGVFRLEVRGSTAEISLYLNPYFIAKGYGNSFLGAAVLWVQKHLPVISKLEAQVLPDNIASMRIFEKQGFSKRATHYEKLLQAK
jgi:UDP-2,4-diacetamido-2,4,6-trideoxy-beta-L-altropyranose hydrolase